MTTDGKECESLAIMKHIATMSEECGEPQLVTIEYVDSCSCEATRPGGSNRQ